VYRDIRIQLRVRRAGQHLDVVTKVHERPAQLLEVDPLTTTVRIAAVREKANAKRLFHTHAVISWPRMSLPGRPGSGEKMSFKSVPKIRRQSSASLKAGQALSGKR